MLNASTKISFHSDDLLTNDLSGQLVTAFTLFDVVMVYIIMVYLAWSKDRKVAAERQPTFLPKRPPFGFRMYAILLETGQSPAGGTTSQVYLRMCGKLTTSPAFTLTCTNEQGRRLFASQNKDLFLVALPHYLGGIEAFEVVTDRSGECPPWFLRSIRAMCLDNGKCWKSKVGAWLRGDKKPYRIKADLIGALSTKDYLNKVMRLNHVWLFPWYRSLGSSFTSLQRWGIHWASVGLGLAGAHYLLYDEAMLHNLSVGRVEFPHSSTHQIVAAGFAGAALSVISASILRFIARISADLNVWPRVDDKDDFEHLLKGLEFAFGAVVCTPQEQYSECLGNVNLTPDQIRKLYHDLENQSSDHIDVKANRSRYSRNDNNVELASSSYFVPTSRMMAHERGFRPSVEMLRNNIRDSDEDSDRSDHQKQGLGAFIRRLWGRESMSSSSDERVGKRWSGTIPSVSARVASGSDSLTSNDSFKRRPLGCATDGYDSLSEGESDQEMATRSTKTDSEIDLVRRPSYIYDIAPKWNDEARVWVQAKNGGNEHHRLMRNRYECTAGVGTECCMRRTPPPTDASVIERYLAEEEELPDGGIAGRCLIFTPLLALLCTLAGLGAMGYIGYQRWFLPNADTLIYLYAVLLFLAVQPIFATADAFFWALLASWRRRSKILAARNQNARLLYAIPEESTQSFSSGKLPSTSVQ